MPQRSLSLMRGYRYLVSNWNQLLLTIGFLGTATIALLSNFVPAIQTNPQILGAFLILTGGSLIHVLIEIRGQMREEHADSIEESFSAARPRMLNEIARESRRKRGMPLVIRIVGMRLTAIQQFLADLAHLAKEHQLGPRQIQIKVYHVNPQYFLQHEPKLREGIRLPSIRYKQQVAVLIGNIGEINSLFANIPNINIEVASYRSIPLFWGIDVDSRILFWGFFLWDQHEQNWVGPENSCLVYRADVPAHKLVFEGLQNRIESLADWAEPSSAEMWADSLFRDNSSPE